jgi:hypothetical protein
LARSAHDLDRVDRLQGGGGPRALEERSVLVELGHEAEHRQVAHPIGRLLGQRERVGSPDPHEAAAQGAGDAGQLVGDRLADVRRAIDRHPDRDLHVGAFGRRLVENAVQPGQRHRARVNRPRRQQRGGEHRDEPGGADDEPVRAHATQAHPPRGK